ncbi:MAG: endonuclease [Chiayiivirga sp.]|jgi:endonuclease I|uniref:putative Ig domain-containing protein n=1 Tax=Chiayiivirga sp. TaxID=2041042 RepID=UPI0025C30769|nr:putative Ig domain-containing protein [Chiayiivirga sp.]MCI1729760.1 endonuclease [Chiayiivirga sp.]
MPLNSVRALGALSFLFAFANAHAQVGSGAVSYGAGGASQNFDALAGTQGSTGSTLPTGWYFVETGSNANTTYLIDDGTSTSGNTFSYGSSGAGDRAFGGLGSGSLTTTIGAQLRNDTGATLNDLAVSFVTEQWRLGDLNGVDRLVFAYSTNATSLSTGAWTAVSALDAVSPVTSGSPGTALNGNAAANRAAISATLTNLALAANGTLWIRWSDANDAGVDDALAVDDVILGTPVDNPPAVASSVPAHNTAGHAFDTSVTVNFTESVSVGGSWFSLSCGAGPLPATATAGPASSFTITPSAALGYSKLCNLTVVASQVSDLDGTIDPMQFNEVIQFETEADDPPSVTATMPGSNATEVPRAANLSVTFNEPVNALPAAFRVFCPHTPETALPFALSSDDDTTFILDPNSDLPASTACRLEVIAAQVTDRDGTTHAMLLDERVGFSTAALAPPEVISTVPAKNATTFPSTGDLQVSFDTSVTLSAGAFTLTCAQSTGISLTPNAPSGANFTLTTGTSLVAGDSCTFTIVAANVTSGDGLHPDSNEVVNFTVAATGAGNYYAGIDASSCAVLRTGLHNLIDDHTAFPYSNSGTAVTDTWDILVQADQNPLNASEILEVYENAHYAKVVMGNSNYNKEHTWPNSYGFNDLNGSTGSVPQSSAYSDTHMLYLSDDEYNSNRGSKPYANCADTSGCTPDLTLAYNGVGGGPANYASGNHNWKKSDNGGEAFGSYEVWSHRKGDMARAVLYMDIRYEGGVATDGNTVGQSEPDLVVTDDRNLIHSRRSTSSGTAYMGLKSALLAWHAADPPDEHEQLRNALIQSYQGNRNPFIDHPEWAECVFSCNCGANQAPSFTSSPVTVATEDQVYSYTVVATDANGNAMTLTAPVKPAWLTLTATGNGSATLSGTPTNAQVGMHNVTLRVSDGIAAPVDQAFTITVSNVNNAPAFTSSPAMGATEDALYSYNVTTTDVDAGATLVLTAPVMPAWLSLTTTGNGIATLSGTPTNAEVGTHNVTLRVSDGIAAAVDQVFTITVSNTNDAPVVAQPLVNRTAQEGVAITAFSVATGFSDVDVGDDLDFSQTGLPAGLVLDAETGQISGTPSAGSAIPSVTVTITATDTGGLTAQQSFLYEVTAAGDGLVIFDNGFEGNN